MFSRRPDRPKEEPRFAPPSTSSRPSDLVAVPGSEPAPPQSWGSPPSPSGAPPNAWPAPDAGDGPTIIAEHDHVEGTLRSTQGVEVMGSFSGRIESETFIRMGDRSTVKADVTAEEVVVAGQYEGKLIARGRLEIADTGHIQGDIEAPRLLLHEGGFIDGALYMTRTDASRSTGDATRTDPTRGGQPKPASVRDAAADAGSPRKAGNGSPRAVGPGTGAAGGSADAASGGGAASGGAAPGAGDASPAAKSADGSPAADAAQVASKP